MVRANLWREEHSLPNLHYLTGNASAGVADVLKSLPKGIRTGECISLSLLATVACCLLLLVRAACAPAAATMAARMLAADCLLSSVMDATSYFLVCILPALWIKNSGTDAPHRHRGQVQVQVQGWKA